MGNLIDTMKFYPRSAIIEICYKCNLHCLHCASQLNTEFQRGEQLTFDEWIVVLDDLISLGLKKLVLSGGEAILSDMCFPLARYASDKGVAVSLISNGFIINDEMATQIKESGITIVALSIDGNEKTHNYIRNHPEAYSRMIRATHALKKVGIQTNFVTTILESNLNELRNIEQVLHDLHADYWQLQIGSALGTLSKHRDLVISPEKLPEIMAIVSEIKSRQLVKVTVSDSIGYFSEDELFLREHAGTHQTRYFLGCMAGCLSIGIESNGNVKGCLSLQDERFIEGNVRKRSIKDIWNDPDAFAYTRQFKLEDLHGGCADCKYGKFCRGGCTFVAFGMTGEIGNNPYCIQHFIEK